MNPSCRSSTPGDFDHEAALLVNGAFVEPGDDWDGSGCVWWNAADVRFTFDLGGMFHVREVTVQVDNNDVYRLEYSADGQNYTSLLTVAADVGEISSGMDTFSSDADQAPFQPSIDFKPAKARYLKVYAVDGDGMYAIAEIQVR